jgi:hypothetical protein
MNTPALRFKPQGYHRPVTALLRLLAPLAIALAGGPPGERAGMGRSGWRG